MKTFQPRIKEVKRNWHLIDAKGQILGRMASNIALLLMGKGKKEFVPHLDMGDFVVVINARKIMLTGATSTSTRSGNRRPKCRPNWLVRRQKRSLRCTRPAARIWNQTASPRRYKAVWPRVPPHASGCCMLSGT